MNGTEVIKIDGIFSMFLVHNDMQRFQYQLYNFRFGWGNGYVALPNWHPFYKKHYDEIPVSCHGGLTYGSLDEDEDLWVIGFDTSHSGDNENNCDFDFVKNETLNLMEQCCQVKEVQRIIKIRKINEIYITRN